MSYTALYRKWRPAIFDDVKGQDHIVTTLKNQIKSDRIGHAYLFCGTRGTGKTSVAKIFAKAVNCENPVDGNPCGQCRVCQAVAKGVSLNVMEIDAASNNGVDNIRQIKEEVEYPPTEGRYKVYIIDEVHMLSIGAFNALLKTLEEPPAYVIFILATTEAHKIPITIMSRCQRYDFRRISIDTIANRLSELMKEENIVAEERAIRYVAKAGDGSMRDALSLLDQCLAFYMGQDLKYDNVLEVLGAVDTEVFSKFYRKVIERDSASLMRLLDDMIISGRDLTQFVSDFVWYLRNLMMTASVEDAYKMIDLSDENMAILKEDAKMADVESIMRYIRVFSELSGQLKTSTQKRVLIEVALIKLTRPEMELDYDSLVERLKNLEAIISNPSYTMRAVAVPVAVSSNDSEAGKQTEETQAPIALFPARSEDVVKVKTNWSKLLNKLSFSTRSFLLQHAKPGNGGENVLLILCQSIVCYSWMEMHGSEELRNVIAEELGCEMEIKLIKTFEVPDEEIRYDTMEDVCALPIETED